MHIKIRKSINAQEKYPELIGQVVEMDNVDHLNIGDIECQNAADTYRLLQQARMKAQRALMELESFCILNDIPDQIINYDLREI